MCIRDRVTEEDEAVVAIAQGCHHVIAAHHLAIFHHLSDRFRSLAVGLQIVGYFRGMVLIYQALVYLEPVTFELRILHRNHLASYLPGVGDGAIVEDFKAFKKEKKVLFAKDIVKVRK